jgi:hypothetical protein
LLVPLGELVESEDPLVAGLPVDVLPAEEPVLSVAPVPVPAAPALLAGGLAGGVAVSLAPLPVPVPVPVVPLSVPAELPLVELPAPVADESVLPVDFDGGLGSVLPLADPVPIEFGSVLPLLVPSFPILLDPSVPAPGLVVVAPPAPLAPAPVWAYAPPKPSAASAPARIIL